jgi:hypothetical protein
MELAAFLVCGIAHFTKHDDDMGCLHPLLRFTFYLAITTIVASLIWAKGKVNRGA